MPPTSAERLREPVVMALADGSSVSLRPIRPAK